MNVTSKIINIILKIFFAFIFLIIAFSFVLAHGISIEKIKLINVEIHNLNLKLEKKLTLSADKVYIKKANTNKELNVNEIKKNILKLKDYKQVLLLFNKIDIKNIYAEDKIAKLYYDKEILNIRSNNLELDISINFYSNALLAKINTFKYKDIYFNGDIKIGKYSKIKGSINNQNNDFSTDIIIENSKNDINIKLNNLAINSQKNTINYIKEIMTPTMKEWLIKRVSFDKFYGDFEFNIHKNELNKTLGNGYFTNVAAKYNDKVAKGLANKLEFELDNFTIHLIGNNINSEDGVKVKRFDLFLRNLPEPDLEINILAENIQYTSEIEKIINGYGVELGFKQLSGNSNARVDIYSNHDHTSNVKVNVDAKGGFIFHNYSFLADVKVLVDKGKVSVKGNANTKEIKANDFSLELDASKKIGEIFVKNAYINYSDFFEYNDKASLTLDLNSKNLFFKDLNMNISLKDGVYIKAKIKELLPYIKKKNEFNIKDGQITINSKEKAILIDIKDGVFDLDIYKNTNNLTNLKEYLNNDENKYTKDDFFIKIIGDNIDLSTKSGILKITVNNDNTDIFANNIMLNLDNIKGDKDKSNVDIFLKNSKIIYKNYILNFKDLALEKIKENTSIKSEFNNGGTLIALINKDTFKAYIRDLSYKTLNEMAQKTLITNGNIHVDAKGKSINNFDGLINLNNANIANTKTYTKLITFIETIPSLITLKSPGFKRQGMRINLASIDFSKNGDIINIKNMNSKGMKADFSGSGIIDLEHNSANILLNVFTLKNTNKVIKSIPVVNNLILGDKDNKIATQIKIYGNLDDLKFKSSIANDIIKSPFTLIKNIVNLPMNLVK